MQLILVAKRRRSLWSHLEESFGQCADCDFVHVKMEGSVNLYATTLFVSVVLLLPVSYDLLAWITTSAVRLVMEWYQCPMDGLCHCWLLCRDLDCRCFWWLDRYERKA